MAFSEIPDTRFTWVLNDFKDLNMDTLPEDDFISLYFTTSREPSTEWYLVLSIKKSSGNRCRYCSSIMTRFKKMIDLKIICDKRIFYPDNIKVDVSIKRNLEKIYTRRLTILGYERECVLDNFMDCEEMFKMLDDGRLEIYVEMFLHNVGKKTNLEVVRNSGFLSDIKFSIKDEEFHAHKAILAAKSPYFYKMFEQNKEINDIRDLDIMPEAFMEILKYIYSGNLEKWVLSHDIIKGATILQMEDLKFDCENYMRDSLTLDSVNSVMILAVECNAQILLNHCLQYIIKNIHEIDQLEKFQCLKDKPHVVLNILYEIFNQLENRIIRIFNNINLSFTKVAMNTSSCQLQDYESFFNSETLSDVTIQVGEKRYQSHKLVLSAKSLVLRRMLTCNMKEAINNLIEIGDIEAEVFEEVLRYMYTGKVENLREYGIEILKAADQYNLDHLKKMCEEFLAENLTPDSVVDIAKIADTYNASFLIEHCSYYIVNEMVDESRVKPVKDIITLDMFIDFDHNIFYEFLNVLSKCCEVISI